MKHAILMKDGSVAIMQLIADDATVEDEINKWHSDQRGQVVSWHEIDESLIPEDRTYRNAWTIDGKAITHDMGKAREIHKARMREARAPLMAALDVEMSRAFKEPASQEVIEAKRQALRDVTSLPEVSAARTPEELKAAWPDVLRAKKRP